LRRRGVLTLPAHIRAKYGLREGDILSLLDLDGVIVLKRDTSALPRLSTKIERMR
jgi:AbrB family looped-hinge helix DNA binding protein